MSDEFYYPRYDPYSANYVDADEDIVKWATANGYYTSLYQYGSVDKNSEKYFDPYLFVFPYQGFTLNQIENWMSRMLFNTTYDLNLIPGIGAIGNHDETCLIYYLQMKCDSGIGNVKEELNINSGCSDLFDAKDIWLRSRQFYSESGDVEAWEIFQSGSDSRIIVNQQYTEACRNIAVSVVIGYTGCSSEATVKVPVLVPCAKYPGPKRQSKTGIPKYEDRASFSFFKIIVDYVDDDNYHYALIRPSFDTSPPFYVATWSLQDFVKFTGLFVEYEFHSVKSGTDLVIKSGEISCLYKADYKWSPVQIHDIDTIEWEDERLQCIKIVCYLQYTGNGKSRFGFYVYGSEREQLFYHGINLIPFTQALYWIEQHGSQSRFGYFIQNPIIAGEGYSDKNGSRSNPYISSLLNGEVTFNPYDYYYHNLIGRQLDQLHYFVFSWGSLGTHDNYPVYVNDFCTTESIGGLRFGIGSSGGINPPGYGYGSEIILFGMFASRTYYQESKISKSFVRPNHYHSYANIGSMASFSIIDRSLAAQYGSFWYYSSLQNFNEFNTEASKCCPFIVNYTSLTGDSRDYLTYDYNDYGKYIPPYEYRAMDDCYPCVFGTDPDQIKLEFTGVSNYSSDEWSWNILHPRDPSNPIQLYWNGSEIGATVKLQQGPSASLCSDCNQFNSTAFILDRKTTKNGKSCGTYYDLDISSLGICSNAVWQTSFYNKGQFFGQSGPPATYIDQTIDGNTINYKFKRIVAFPRTLSISFNPYSSFKPGWVVYIELEIIENDDHSPIPSPGPPQLMLVYKYPVAGLYNGYYQTIPDICFLNCKAFDRKYINPIFGEDKAYSYEDHIFRCDEAYNPFESSKAIPCSYERKIDSSAIKDIIFLLFLYDSQRSTSQLTQNQMLYNFVGLNGYIQFSEDTLLSTKYGIPQYRHHTVCNFENAEWKITPIINPTAGDPDWEELYSDELESNEYTNPHSLPKSHYNRAII